MNYLDKYLLEINKSKLSDVSKKTIKSTFNKLSIPSNKSPKDFVNTIYLKLKDIDKLNSQHTLLAHIKSILKNTTLKNDLTDDDIREIDNLFLKFKTLKEQTDDNFEANEKQNNNYISYDELVNHYKKVKDKMNWKHRLIYGLYVLQPPLRADYGDVKIIINTDDDVDDDDLTSDKTQNYYLVHKSTFIINQYKSNKVMDKNGKLVHKPLVFEVNEEVADLIYDSLKASIDYGEPREYLIEDQYGKPMSANALSKMIIAISKKYYDMPISINDIRHIYSSRFLLQNEDVSIETILEDATALGHSVQVHLKKYMKNYTKQNKPVFKEKK
jgi:hypothetical protein